ncbi:hypothetical protein KUL150_04130 [Alteromonas sp. KUL150]|uniref:hypothetical protein n=1 Tax=Alteromonas sp. KUL150 TaxID=2480805 RepID=UPI0012E50B0B|nr:hypothetical protein [Alteromonas sp. KUL150]GFD84354.1 hypothetical protein KUL150_04130 [Alteromonas sp. KUL150]
MSNKTIPNSTLPSSLDKESTAANGTAVSPFKSSPLFGWLYAGTDLIAARLDQAAGMVSQKIDDTQETINAMQAKGLEVESELRQTLNPFALVDVAQKFVTSTPLFSVLSGGQRRQQKEHQLEALNAKVDLLVEQVALLAAKEAAKQVKANEAVKTSATVKNTPSKASAAAKPTRARKTTASTTKSAPAGATASSKKSASSTASKSAAAKSPTRKTAAVAKKEASNATSSSASSTTNPSATKDSSASSETKKNN